MRTPYVTIVGMAPNVREKFRSMLADPDQKYQLERYFEDKLRPTIEKIAGMAGEDYESWMVDNVITGDEYLKALNPDESLPFSSRMTIDYLFEGWLDSDGVIKDTDTFEDELGKLENVLIVYFNIDI